ncbi:MAG: S1/P1 nuclease [Gammaproteobacteria bacterium]
MKRLLYVFLLSSCLSSAALAWDSNGHQVIAQIAYDNLRPEVKAQVEILVPIVGQYYELNDFVSAAPWADWLKGDNVHAYDEWHYIDQPVTQGTCNKCTLPLPSPASENVVWAIQQAIQVLSTPSVGSYPQEHVYEKSMFLLFLEHFVGDIHQPLHAVSLFSDTFPNGDQGGNLYTIKATIANNLHSYWDQGGGVFPESSMSETQLKVIAIKIEHDYPETTFGAKATDLNPINWSHESQQLAQNIVYKLPENVVPNKVYTKIAQQTAEQQAALAGYRLANLLNQMFEQQQ